MCYNYKIIGIFPTLINEVVDKVNYTVGAKNFSLKYHFGTNFFQFEREYGDRYNLSHGDIFEREADYNHKNAKYFITKKNHLPSLCTLTKIKI